MLYYLKALLYTELAECAFAGAVSRDLSWVVYIFLINAVTNPIVNILYRGAYPLIPAPWYYVLLLLLELAVVVAEACLIYLLGKTESFKAGPLTKQGSLLYALSLNAFSFCVGLILKKAGCL